MKNKLKLSLIVIATLVAGNTNAQTYYSCIPQGCPAGQYFDGVHCLDLPTVSRCTAGYVWDENKSDCFKETCTKQISAEYIISADSGVSYTKGDWELTGYKSETKTFKYYTYTVTMKQGTCIEYRDVSFNTYSGGKPLYAREDKTSCCYDK